MSRDDPTGGTENSVVDMRIKNTGNKAVDWTKTVYHTSTIPAAIALLLTMCVPEG